ncbi:MULTISPECIES: pyridoxamine 5'-phosphate oxidase family protein [Ralstonia]|uniref:pyridoxamine 5'-phosphate oxidase family protein n=1 Tax=Ralstonia TaxID=48736 RepID=UPI000386CB36|nr:MULTISPECIES: pyridoxamine 5'-phosphate oxidase family protein [Ralstonia]EPX95345.1 pyridoxamine 5'-phosphate oxidase [Ralstonia sp. AU12-08]MBY4707976.1 pyridoxamine 5'-phosphate oxidase family protein [Ralstonia insidiosa]GAQ28600.1 pyridoxamine 5'-phosphate oxidase-like protein [Ralstonia sp. NT80]
MSHTLKTVADLEAVYGTPNPRSVLKEIDHLNADYRAFVEASPFIVLSSVGEQGTDASPKGDAPGFVRILDERTLVIPDRPGNNRIDNLRNIVEDGRVSVLFIVPGAGETLRVNGTATISTDPELLAASAVQGKLPRSVIIVNVQSVYFHCSKAVVRSRLWERGAQETKPALPTAGRILQHISGGAFDGEAYDRELPERLKTTLY